MTKKIEKQIDTLFKKGNKGGGRPVKLKTELIAQGFTQSEISQTIRLLMSMTVDELADVWKNPKASVLEKTVANAIRKGIEQGRLDAIETLITRVYGKPKENIDHTIQSIVIKQGGSKHNH